MPRTRTIGVSAVIGLAVLALSAAHAADRPLKQLEQRILLHSALRPASAGVAQVPDAGESRAVAGTHSGGSLDGAAGGSRTQSYGTNRAINDVSLDSPSGADAQVGPSIAAWGPFVVAAWTDGRATLANAIAYAYSTDGGATFVTAPTTGLTALPVPSTGGHWSGEPPVVTVNEKTGDFYLCGVAEPGTGSDVGIAVTRANFINGTIRWTPPVLPIRLPAGAQALNRPWIAVDSLSGNLYVTYTHSDFTAAIDSVLFTRSTDRGLTWSPPLALNSSAAAGFVDGARPAVGPAGEVYVTWKEIGVTATSQDFMRIRRSTSFGAHWDAEATAAAFYDDFGSGAPGYGREQGLALPSIAVDRSEGPHRGRVYVAWNESVDYFDSIPNGSTVLNEIEPNDTTTTAQRFTPGVSLHGSHRAPDVGGSDPGDTFDYFKFVATQGATYLFWANQFANQYTMRIFGTDGVTRLAFSGWRFGSPTQGFIAWTCPRNGTYYLRMAWFNLAGGPWVINTGIDMPGGFQEHARDQRDVFAAYSDDGSAWSAPVMLNAAEPAGFDDWLPEVAVDAQGEAYALWYDFSDSPVSESGGASQAHMATSHDGGATWNSLGPVTDQFTHWTSVNSNLVANQGDHISLFANATSVFPCWTDGRLGTPDIWTAPFATGDVEVAILGASADTMHVSVAWRATGPYPPTAEVLRGPAVGPYETIGSLAFGDGSRATFSDLTSMPGTQYRYALRIVVAGSPRVVGEQVVMTPDDIATPALASLISARFESGRATVRWDVSGVSGDVAIQRRDDASAWTTLATEPAGGGTLTYVDATVRAGTRYHYRLAYSNGGAIRYTAESELWIPGAPRLELEGATPNPASRGIRVAFTLADRSPLILDLVDLAGRVVASRRIASPDPGRHVEPLDSAHRIRPGVYFVRLTQGRESRVARVSVAE